MTIIEVIVAALILCIGMIALLSAFDSSRRLGTSAEEHQTASTIAESELHRIESLSWAQIALTAEPTKAALATSTNPTYYEAGGTCALSSPYGPPASSPCYQWDWGGSAGLTSTTEPLVISSSGDSAADPTPWSTTVINNGSVVRLNGMIYRFITWVNDPNCTLSTCGASSDDKRILVAVTGTGLNTPTVLTALVTNPVGGSADPLSGGKNNCLENGRQVPCIG
jgi:Tfp pilus assembly protein PilV